MRLPQDRILHIDTELAGDEVRIVAEWQGELVRCKDCKHRDTDECLMYYEEWYEIDEGDGYADTDFIIHDYTKDNGFCHHGERSEK